MKILKVLFTSMALLAFGGTMAFADGATIVDTAEGSGLDTNDTYAGAEDDALFGEIPGNGLTTNEHSLSLLADVEVSNLTPTLYYNLINVNSDAVLYDGDWDLNTGFTTAEFSIGLDGTTLATEYLRVTVAATPFVLYDTDTTTVKDTAGAMTVSHVAVTETLPDATESISQVIDGSIATSSEVTSPTAFTIQSVAITDDTTYASTTPVVSFTLNTASHSDTLLAGRYKSIVTLTYTIA